MKTTLSLSETAEHKVKRDQLTVFMRVEERGTDTRKMQEAVNRRLKAALTAAKEDPRIVVTSTGYSINEEYQRNQTNKNETKRWVAQASFSLAGSDFDAIYAMAGKLQRENLEVADMSYSLNRQTAKAHTDELTKEALETLKERAEKVATTMGLTLQGFDRIEVGTTPQGGYAARAMLLTLDAAPSGAGPQAAQPTGEAGEATVQITVAGTAILK